MTWLGRVRDVLDWCGVQEAREHGLVVEQVADHAMQARARAHTAVLRSEEFAENVAAMRPAFRPSELIDPYREDRRD